MAGKYEQKRKNTKKNISAKKKSKRRKTGRGLMLAVAVVLILLAAAIAFMVIMQPGEADNLPENAHQTTEFTQQSGNDNAEVDEVEEVSIYLGRQMQIVDIGSYTGIYVEDGTDELVSGVLMMVVKNISENDIQYAEIDLDIHGDAAHFSLSTLPAGESVVVLEQSRMEYIDNIDYSTITAASNNVAVADEPLSLHEDKLKIQTMDGAINVTNISGEDIPNDISIYYKNSADDIYYGGITYRVTLTGGMKADELKQIMASHFNQPGSKVMFVTFGA